MSVCDLPVISGVCDTAGEQAASLVTAPFDWLAQSVGQAAAWMYETVWEAFASTTLVDLTSPQYTRVYNILFGVAVLIMIGFFLLQVIGGMIRREPAALTRALLGLAKSVFGSFVALSLLATALEITDRLCVGIVHATGTTMEQMGERITLLASGLLTINVAAPGAGAVLTFFLSGLALGAALIVWMSLLIRKALLLIAIVFAPIALSGATWDATRGWVSRWAAFVIALILSKVVLVVVFLLATAQVSAPINADLTSVSEPIAGVVLMLVAGFAPYMTYKAIQFMGFDMYHAMSAEQEAKSALNRPVPIPSGFRLGAPPPKVLDTGSSSPTAPPTDRSAGAAGGPAAPVPGGASSAGAAIGTSRVAAATGGVAAAGMMLAKGTASTGTRVGAATGAAADQHAEAAHSSPPAPVPPLPRSADPTPSASHATPGLNGRPAAPRGR